MHYYSHHIADFNNATRHLDRNERSIYVELLWLYYDKEEPLPDDPGRLSRLILASGESEVVGQILNEFFVKTGDGFINPRCDEEIAKYQAKANRAIRANKKRWGSNNDLKSDADQIPTNNQEPGIRNQEPGTNNQEPTKGKKSIVELKPDPGEVTQLFEFWQQTLNHPRAALNDKRKALIKKSLGDYTLTDLMCAVSGCSLTPHNMGDNDRGEVYDSIELILRDAAHIDRFMANNDNPPKGKIKTIGQTASENQAQADRIKKAMGASDDK